MPILHIPPHLDLNHLDVELSELPPQSGSFPTGVFPQAIQQLIATAHDALAMPPDFLAGAVLFAASLGIGNTHRILIKSGWSESAVLYVALVGKAGTNKSHPLSFALAPFFEYDKKAYHDYKIAYEQFTQQLSLAKADRQTSETSLQKPILQKFLVSDFTPEALAEIHAQNPRGIGVYADELISWIKNFNRYAKGSEEQFWLSNWSGKPVISDRKSTRFFIDQPFISVIGSLQNAVLADMAGEHRHANGFLDRILFVMPDALRKPYWTDHEMPAHFASHYHSLIHQLLQLPLCSNEFEMIQPVILPLCPQARQLLFDWQHQHTDLANEAGNEALTSMYAKLEIYTPRLALILQMLFWACGEGDKNEVGLAALQGAIRLADYFRHSAEKVHHLLSRQDPTATMSLLQKQVYDCLPETFTTQAALSLAAQMGMTERSFKRWLTDKQLFLRIARGQYEKLL